MADLARLSHTHEAVLNWLVLNPEKSMAECAGYFGYSQSWLSQLVHSDLFQHALKEKQLEIGLRVAQSIPARLTRLADIGLDKLAEQLEKTNDPDFVLEATDKVLHRMGYAPTSARNPAGSPAQFAPALAQQNNFFVTSGDLAEARALMQAAAVAQASSVPIPLEGECVELPRE